MTGTTNGTGLLRPRFFDRQQLRAADLTLAQDYLTERLRRHNRFVHGWGVVCGGVVSATADPDVLTIGPGYALSPRGDEIHIPSDVPFDVKAAARQCLPDAEPCADPGLLEDPSAGPLRTTCVDFSSFEVGTRANPVIEEEIVFEVLGSDGETRESAAIVASGDHVGLDCGFTTEIVLPLASEATELTLAGAVGGVGIIAFDDAGSVLARASAEGEAGGPETVALRASGITRLVVNAPGNELVLLEFCMTPTGGTRQVYLVACPQAEMICPAPAVPAACQPPGGVYELSRVRESVRFDVVCDLPESHAVPPETCDELDAIVCDGAIPACPATSDDNCVVLATLIVGGNRVEIDNQTHRRQLLSESLHLAHSRCQCLVEPPPPPPPPPTSPPPTTSVPTLTIATRPSLIEDVTRFTLSPSVITLGPTFAPTVTPSLLTSFTVPTFLFTREPGPIFDFDPLEFDLIGGARQPIERIPGIDAGTGEALRDAGVGSVLEFAAMPVERAAGVLGVSAVRVAELQDAARGVMRRR